jgi:heat shock protein HtpX
MYKMFNEQIYTVDLEIAPIHRVELLDFIQENYLRVKKENFSEILKKYKEDDGLLSFKVSQPGKDWKIGVEIMASNPLKLTLSSDNNVPSKFMEDLKEDLLFLVQLFEDNVRHSTLYFSWIEGNDILPEQPPTNRTRLSDRLFSSNLILIYIILFAFYILIFLLFGLFYAIIGIIVIQLSTVLLSDRLFLLTNKWRITPENPLVHIVEYQLPIEEYKDFQKKFGKETVVKMKKEIYDKTLAVGKDPTCEIGEETMESYGFKCNPRSRLVKVVDVYNIVKNAADKFKIPVPKIVISNTMVPNAAATGPSPRRGLVLITTGLLVQLEDDEILSVLGHEMGHLQGRDPILLFSLIMAQYIFYLIVILPILISINGLFTLIYLVAVFAVIFFIAKFFETRADLVSAMKIGQPKVLAESLRKIGYTRLQLERTSSIKLPQWISFDTHPPIYFRVDRLEKMNTIPDVKHPIIQSIKDMFEGIRRSFG